VDPVSGDKLTVQGNGSLNFSLNPSGRMTLSGRYNVGYGSYTLTLYNLLKREFTVKPGGYIAWIGDPFNADINITALYTARTSAAVLMQEGISSSQEVNTAYNQMLDFEVNLIMTGSLLRPSIAFAITLPTSQRGANAAIYQKLSQLNSANNEAELNKQVFALLVFNTFIAPDPLATGGSGSYVETLARNSASQLLSSQLNRLSSSVLKGVNLNFNLNSYNDVTSTGGTQTVTTLDVGLRHNLFNNRLQVYVGSHFPISGREQGATSNLSGDFSLEYLIKPDGRMRVGAFSRQDYEDIFEGQVIETGVTFTLMKDYNTLGDLFRKQVSADNSAKNKKSESNTDPK